MREGAEEAFVGIHDVVDRALEILRALAINEVRRAGGERRREE